MKTCPNCGAQVADTAAFCTSCGFNLGAAAPQEAPQGMTPPEGSQPVLTMEVPQTPPPVIPQPQPQYQMPQYNMAPEYPLYAPENPCDKPLGIVALCFNFIGVLIAYFGGDVDGRRSDYLRFFANEALVMDLFGLLAVIPWIGWLWGGFVAVCKIIAIVYACKGETKPVLFFGTIRIIK